MSSCNTLPESFECSEAIAMLSKGGEEVGYGTSALLEPSAEFVAGELRTGVGGLEAKPSEFCVCSADDVPLRMPATRARIRFLLIVSGDWSNSSFTSKCLDAL